MESPFIMMETLPEDVLVVLSRRRCHGSFPTDFSSCHSLASPSGQREVEKEGPGQGLRWLWLPGQQEGEAVECIDRRLWEAVGAIGSWVHIYQISTPHLREMWYIKDCQSCETM